MKKKKKFKRIIVFDFDGVINSYASGWLGLEIIADLPVRGIKELLDEVIKEFDVYIVSSRCIEEKGIAAIKKYMEKHNLPYTKIQAEKPPAFLTVDDRCICFKGDTRGLLEKIKTFSNWV
jgi:phosphoglycolate phosphatase-like HAD superfamily hydrolase